MSLFIKIIIYSIILTWNIIKNSLNETLIAKILIDQSFPNNCTANPLLNLLPTELLNNITNTLYDTPNSKSNSYCNFQNGLTCCSQDTIQILYTQFIEIEVPKKLQIFSKNLQYLGLIIDEHVRNFQIGFNIDASYTNSLFSTYYSYIFQLMQLADSIVQKSLTFKWNSYCNYICSSDAYKYCTAYNSTYSHNNNIIFKTEYNCTIDNPLVTELKELIKSYSNMYNNVNNTLRLIYSEITKSVINNVQMLTGSNQLSNNSELNLILNSLNDGLNVANKIAKPPICNNTNNKVSCEMIQAKICVPFYCLDDCFLQFYDDSVINYTSILNNSNWAILSINTDTSYINLTDFSSDIADYLRLNIQFYTNGFYTSINFQVFLAAFLILFVF